MKNKNIFLFFAAIITILATVNLINGYSFVGKTFWGFPIEFTLNVSPQSNGNWTGHDQFKDYERITAIEDNPLKSIKEFKSFFHNIPPGVPVKYNLQGEETKRNVTITTMVFTAREYLETYIKGFIFSLVYLIISLFLIIKLKENTQIKALIIFTLSFSSSLSLFYDFDLLHSFVPVAFLSYMIVSFSLINLGLSINEKVIKPEIKNIIYKLFLYTASITYISFLIHYFIIKDNLDSPFYSSYILTYTLSILFIALSFVTFVVLLFYGYYRNPLNSIEKTQSRVVFTGALLSFTPFIIIWFIHYSFGYSSLVSWDLLMYSFILFPFFLIYAIARYKAFNIELYIRKALIYAVLSGILLLTYFSITSFIAIYLHNIFKSEGNIIAISSVIATIIAGKLNMRVQNFIDKAFYRQKLDLQNVLEKFISDAPTIIKRETLANECFYYIEKALNPENCSLYIQDNSNRLSLLSSMNGLFPKFIYLGPDTMAEESKLDINSLLLLQDVEMSFKRMINSDYEMIVPVQSDKKLLGILFLGKKKADTEYLFEEKNFMKSYATTLSMAINTIMLTESSIDLAIKNKELENKTDFLKQLSFDLGHDLKSPVSGADSSINNIRYAIKEGREISAEYIKDNVEKAAKILGKLKEYIETTLDKEMISLGKLKLRNDAFDLREVCNDSILIHSDYENSRNIKVVVNIPDEDMYIIGDRIRFEHSISNLISNALKYTRNYLGLKVEVKNREAIIQIQDNGFGIPKEMQSRIFQKFEYKQADKSKNKSTGLGLYLCKFYIEKMSGSVWFETKENEGTVFFIRIPLTDKRSYKIDNTEVDEDIELQLPPPLEDIQTLPLKMKSEKVMHDD